ncbi:MAG: SDR family oxidoreductase [Deltaproteobacteria bacterium]|nr:SDR family oxidoreductase [Deltaproteobacteria bacterium]
MRLENKVALITGAGGGIGRAIAERFAEEGAKVVVNDISGSTVKETAEGIRAKGGSAIPIQGDTSRESDVEKAVALAVDTYGGLDILVNNAGIEVWKLVHEMTVEEWERVMSVNMRGVFLMSKHAVRQMIAQDRGGAIVNLSSAGGLVGLPQLGVYCASKHGVIGLTKTMALELRAHNIRINAMCPSFIDTEMVSRSFDLLRSQGVLIDDLLVQLSGRLGTTREVANLALFLASDESSFINGAAVPIDNACTAQ